MKTVVLDIEANGLLHQATDIWCAVGIDVNTREVSRFTPDNISEIKDYLSTVDLLVGHNIIGYDIPLLEKVLDYKYLGEILDTLVLSWLLEPRLRQHGLESWGYRFGILKPKHEEWSYYSKEMLHRCEEDVRINHHLYDHLTEKANKHWNTSIKTTMAFFDLMSKQERHGWLMDQDLMNRSISMLTHWMDRIDRIVVPGLPKVKVVAKPLEWHREPFKGSGDYKQVTFNWLVANGYDPSKRPLMGPFSPMHYRDRDLGKRNEVVEYLLESGWIPRQWNLNCYGEVTSPKLNADDPLDGLKNRRALLISKYITCRHRRSQIEGWFKRLGPTGKLHQAISGIATTGRLKHKNIVNVPGADSFFGKTMRRCFIARQGYAIIGIDASACQNRMLASRVGDPAFTEILVNGDKEKGTSIHQVNQQAIRKDTGLEVTYHETKALNYAFLFGASNKKLGSMVNRSADMGKKIREALLGVAPGFKTTLDKLTSEWKAGATESLGKYGKPAYKNGSIKGLDGRPIMIENEHQVLNYALQSDEAILMQLASLFMYKFCTDKGWIFGEDYAFLAHVHDEINSEVREEIAEEFCRVGCRAFSWAGAYLELDCPQQGEARIGPTWYEVH